MSIPRLLILAAITLGFLTPRSALHATAGLPSDVYLFSSFRDNGQDGLHLAWSADGLKWEPLRKDLSFLRPEVGGKLMRDPCIARDPDGVYHMVWTDSWTGRTIGYASSPDLVTWSPQRLIPVMEHEKSTRNSWAPEITYDEKRGQWLIYWSSTIPGRFDESAGSSESDYNHRIFATTTKDFKTFTPTRLLFDPGYSCIDATILPRDGKWLMFFKDEIRQPVAKKNLLLAVADDIEGPYTVEPRPVTPPGSWVEGPTAIDIDGRLHVYFDCYTRHRYDTLVSSDLVTWDDISRQVVMPKGTRHGTVLRVPADLIATLDDESASAEPAADAGPSVAPVPSPAPVADAASAPAGGFLIPGRADPHVVLHSDGYYYFTATVPAYDLIELRRARTLEELAAAEPVVAWRKYAEGPMSHHIWAPEIHHLQGKWYIYFAASRAEAIWDIRMYVLENESANPLEGTWTEKGKLQMNWESFTLDATTFHVGGVRYLAWAQSAPRVGGTNIYIAKMDTPWSITGEQIAITKPDLPWERVGHNVNEAPSVIVRNGRVFMTYSASATDANYCLGLLTADENADLLDPAAWTKSPLPVLKSDPLISEFGPGHNCFTTTPDGQTDLLVYHARDYERIEGDPLVNPDRAIRARVLRWLPDGTPDFAGSRLFP